MTKNFNVNMGIRAFVSLKEGQILDNITKVNLQSVSFISGDVDDVTVEGTCIEFHDLNERGAVYVPKNIIKNKVFKGE